MDPSWVHSATLPDRSKAPTAEGAKLETGTTLVAAEATARAETRRLHEKHRGYVRKAPSFATNRNGRFKKKMNGEVVLR